MKNGAAVEARANSFKKPAGGGTDSAAPASSKDEAKGAKGDAKGSKGDAK